MPDQILDIEHPENDLGVPDIDSEQHQASP